jgi:hypothetical protein
MQQKEFFAAVRGPAMRVIDRLIQPQFGSEGVQPNTLRIQMADLLAGGRPTLARTRSDTPRPGLRGPLVVRRDFAPGMLLSATAVLDHFRIGGHSLRARSDVNDSLVGRTRQEPPRGQTIAPLQRFAEMFGGRKRVSRY